MPPASSMASRTTNNGAREELTPRPKRAEITPNPRTGEHGELARETAPRLLSALG
jgi:hypothetical protein